MNTQTLPSFPTAFVGRATELQEIGELLTQPNCRLLTLVGAGGMGKTRLAVEAAMQQLDLFQEGVIFVALQPFGEGDLLVTAILEALHLKIIDVSQKTEKEQLLECLEDQQLLLVLDNFEHLLDKTDVITELLENSPQLKILVTSRIALNIQHEWVRPVLGMSYPEQDQGQSLETYSATQLFIECAHRSHSSFDPERERAHIIRICQLVGGMPLGIELAAAWLRTLSCAAITEEVQHSLDILETQKRDVPERHRSVRAVFDSSWNMLTSEEKTVFMRLSVFRGTPTRDAIHNVTEASVAMLSALVDKALITRVEGDRYTMHELLRQYAEDKLDQSELANTTRDAHSRHYMNFLRDSEHDLWGQRQLDTADDIETDFENMRSAWYWALEHGDEEALSQAIEPLCIFLWMRSRWTDGRFMLSKALDYFTPKNGEQPPLIVGKILSRYLIDTKNLHGQINRALEIARFYNNPIEIAMCYFQLGYQAGRVGKLDESMQYAKEALALFQQEGDTYHEVAMLSRIGSLYRLQGDYTNALIHIQQAIRVGQKANDWFSLAAAYGEQASLLLIQGNLSEAERIHTEGQRLASKTQRWLNIWMLFESAATFEIGLRGNLQGARQKIEEAWAIREIAIMDTSKALSMMPQSLLAAMEGDYETAFELGDDAYPLAESDAWGPYFRWGIMAALAGLEDYDDLAKHTHILLAHFQKLRVNAWLLVGVSFAAILAAYRDQSPERATELLALASTHQHSLQGWLRIWKLIKDLKVHLEDELGTVIYQAAWEHGTQLQLDDVVRELLSEDYRDGTIPVHIQAANNTLIDPLSERELEVLGLIAVGYSNQEIADQLVVGVATVKKHITHIYSKLDVDSRTKAMIRAKELQIV